MNKLHITGLYVMRRIVELGYPCLESFISSREASDDQILCVDPDGEETVKLARAIVDRFDTARIVWFKWPLKTTDGSAIGYASNFALNQATGTHVINVQSDEVYHPGLVNWMKTEMRDILASGIDCIRLKILSTQFNCQEFQGGETWDGLKSGDVWNRGGLFNGVKGGAGYNCAIKVARRCPAIRFERDAWSFSGCAMLHHARISEEFPVMHLHDMMRDHYVDIRRNAAESIWNDPGGKYEFYKASADNVESTQAEWFSNPIWTRTTSPFMDLLPDVAKPLIGQTHYSVNWELLNET